MRVQVTGVLEDGTPRRAGVPVNSRRNLNVPHGIDLTLEVDVITPLGTPVSLEGEGTELLLTIKKRSAQSPPDIVKAASLNGNKGTFLVQPGDTRRLIPGLFSWDVWLTKDGVRDPVVPLSPLQLQAANAAVPAQPPPAVLDIVENDTDPIELDFAGENITGWVINLNVATPTPTVLGPAVLTDPTNGFAEITRTPGDLPPGSFAGELESTQPGPTTKTSDVFIVKVRAEIA